MCKITELQEQACEAFFRPPKEKHNQQSQPKTVIASLIAERLCTSRVKTHLRLMKRKTDRETVTMTANGSAESTAGPIFCQRLGHICHPSIRPWELFSGLGKMTEIRTNRQSTNWKIPEGGLSNVARASSFCRVSARSSSRRLMPLAQADQAVVTWPFRMFRTSKIKENTHQTDNNVHRDGPLSKT